MATGQRDVQSATLVLLTAVVGGGLAVLASLLAFNLLIGDQATEAARHARIASHLYWTQPIIYIMAGLIAAAEDSRWGPLRAPVIGLFLASVCWTLLRRQELLPAEVNILAYLLPAGALFGLLGALIAPLIKERVSTAVTAIVLLGLGAFVLAYLNLGAISGEVQREVIERAQGMTTAMRTVGVPDAKVALLDTDTGRVLYVSQTGRSGHFHISHVPIGDYHLRVWDPDHRPTVVTQPVEVDRAITGGKRWETVSLRTVTRDSGALFR